VAVSESQVTQEHSPSISALISITLNPALAIGTIELKIVCIQYEDHMTFSRGLEVVSTEAEMLMSAWRTGSSDKTVEAECPIGSTG
jgi:hypothetical protein